MASYSSSGEFRWAKQLGSENLDVANGVAVDASGNVSVTGYYAGRGYFGGDLLFSSGSSRDVFVASYDSSGAHRWSKHFGGAGDDRALAVAVDGEGNTTVTGTFRSAEADFGGDPLANAGTMSTFVASYDPVGAHRWSRSFDGTGFNASADVAVDASGNVTVTGRFTDTVDFGGIPLTSAGGTEIFVASYDQNGVHRWSQRFGTSANEIVHGLAVDDAGNATITGYFQGTLNFGGSPLTSVGPYDIYLANYGASGAHRWSQRFGGAGEDVGQAVAVSSSGNVIVTGTFDGPADFGAGPVTSDHRDIFILQLGLEP